MIDREAMAKQVVASMLNQSLSVERSKDEAVVVKIAVVAERVGIALKILIFACGCLS
jgi:hypothetical protein